MLNWRLPGFGLVLGLILTTLILSFGPIATGPTLFFGLTISVLGLAIFIGAVPTNHPSSRPRALLEWTLIGAVWILIALIILTILTLH